MAETTLNLVVIRASEMEKLAQFYQQIGLTFTKHRHGSGPEHYSAEMNGCVFEIYPRRNETDSTTSVRLGFRVADIGTLIRTLAEAGIKIVADVAESEWGRRAVVETRTGIVLNLFRRELKLSLGRHDKHDGSGRQCTGIDAGAEAALA